METGLPANILMNVKVINKKNILTSRYFSIEKVILEQDGRQFTKDLMKRNDVVLILPVTSNNELYLVSQYRVAWDKVLLEVVAGNIEDGQSPLDAAKAELEEETGLQAKQWERLGTFYLSANITGLIHIFIAQDLEQGKAHPDTDEKIETIKMPMTEVMTKIADGEIRTVSNITAILLFEKRRKEGRI